MRDIKFRGKRKLNGEWVYGSLIQIGNDWCQIVKEGTEYDEVRNYMYRVISETVGEYTGLKDKNGKDGYHKDIVQGGNKFYTIEWQDAEARFWLAPYNHSGNWKFMDELDHMEIAGNIYENFELQQK